ncbi:50S ribosomal protein L30, partial [Candidatus Woesearchaeota archaeon CG08_land_8_20_14_0_20_43_7]
QLKLGKLSKLFLAANCPADALEDIKHYSSMDSVEVVQLDIKNDELGMLCKRQHNISMLGIQK